MRHIFPSRLNIGLKIFCNIGFRLQKAFHDITHTLQRCERHHDNALGGDGAIEHFSVTISRRFFVTPNDILTRPFKGLPPLFVRFEAQETCPTRDMPNHPAFQGSR